MHVALADAAAAHPLPSRWSSRCPAREPSVPWRDGARGAANGGSPARLDVCGRGRQSLRPAAASRRAAASRPDHGSHGDGLARLRARRAGCAAGRASRLSISCGLVAFEAEERLAGLHEFAVVP